MELVVKKKREKIVLLTHRIGKRIVTIMADGAYRYQSRLFSRQWLESKNLEKAIPDHLQKYIVLP